MTLGSIECIWPHWENMPRRVTPPNTIIDAFANCPKIVVCQYHQSSRQLHCQLDWKTSIAFMVGNTRHPCLRLPVAVLLHCVYFYCAYNKTILLRCAGRAANCTVYGYGLSWARNMGARRFVRIKIQVTVGNLLSVCSRDALRGRRGFLVSHYLDAHLL